MSTPSYHVDHPVLGAITGLARGSDIAQFRGIPFASIPARFRQSSLNESLPSIPFDARFPGPTCPQLKLPFPTYWDAPPPADYPALPVPSQDEFNCLNLCITAPRFALEKADKAAELPVLVFIHGGAFVGGSQSLQIVDREIYDATNLVRASIARDQPTIIVTINYRVGHLGFLASEELAAVNRANGEPVGNYGLHDQRQALEWVSRFIGGFGGSADRVTIHGTSAGGSSCHYQTSFPHRRFQRAILSSGTIVGIGPREMSWHQDIFSGLVQWFSKPGDADPIKRLQSVPIEDLLSAPPPMLYNPLIDGDWVLGGTMKSILSRPDSQAPPAIMIGATEYERDLTKALLSDFSTPLPHEHKSDAEMMLVAQEMFSGSYMVPPASATSFPFAHTAVAEAYSLSTDQSPSTVFENWGHLLADISFRAPPLHVAESTVKHHSLLKLENAPPVLVYEIHATNPYKGFCLTYNRANHGVNDLMLFDPAEDQVPAEHLEDWRGAVKQVQGAWLDFAHGKVPWTAYNAERERGNDGPVYVIKNASQGVLCRKLSEVDGETVGARWRALLDVVEQTA